MSKDQSRVKWLSRCSTGACVEVAALDGRVLVRDSKDREGPVMAFSRSAWSEFLDGVREGEVRR
ncbi:DUF397 domain-containing protein [Asanoa sp. WMMD1127]|uniref:DUF397 domain-containing protein n=1 Tax=Asanoa sp. WMMD1127 TaxID=3016107 RepID=UPI002415C1CE|nr:DUF397 domain-containing protein [Asanoa sp. WMMD1127]MDG4822268.1 DUF397 domain-containing protein [Asanoa sp. WMMD1127]